ncbi:flagellar hook-basal body complex protein FliE [Leptospira perolatii]|uniref:Flagellar hook-basal body complex protein FliE n=1 Tax=Leptospira perolatii TaxID=2023191 RepID=A0A2M9ZRV7_9LEPT|nr:flagellar hook-basal body complex protein FliE [Leptospira perolatii]PJZ71269.1 flagellar hook-basal body complex protein FliE [Leptospira perolatii]PJZ74802.1 flagellar hook-basal body complex protein FliE [Leptospira perolatii]
MQVDFNSKLWYNYNSGYSDSRFPLSPKGERVNVNTQDDRHYKDVKEPVAPDYVAESFSEAMRNAFKSVNDLQVEADEMTQKMVFNPNSVDAHEVMIASEKARVALTFTKTLADGVVRAYRELTNMR